jgi:hypothetical protein
MSELDIEEYQNNLEEHENAKAAGRNVTLYPLMMDGQQFQDDVLVNGLVYNAETE